MMTMSDYKYNMNNFFCPAPWRSMFYHVNKVSVCCISSKQFDMSPTEFQNSEYLKNLRQKFLDGEYDDTCSACKKLEDAGLQSIREHMVALYGDTATPDNIETELDYMELRTSNLCNFQCKMCNAQNSSLIAGSVTNISEDNFQTILKLAENLKHLTLTGGEPMLIKHYYELLDHLVSLDKSDLTLKIYTNASVYNPVFVEKILKFNTYLHLSIDAVGNTAENLRVGTNWKVVDENINKFLQLPLKIIFHTTITGPALEDIHSLAQYFVDISKKYPNCKFLAHTVRAPVHMAVAHIPKNKRLATIDSIDQALNILTDPMFTQLRAQLISCKRVIVSTMQTPKPTLNDTHQCLYYYKYLAGI